MEMETYMLTFIWMLLIGLIVGALAKLIMPGKGPGGIFVTILLGIAGALVAVFTGRGGYFCAGADLKAVAAGDPNK